MRVYMVEYQVEYETGSVDSIFSTRKLANKRIDTLTKEDNYCYYGVVEIEVDKEKKK